MVAIVEPVAIFSANSLPCRLIVTSGDSFASDNVIVRGEVVEFVPSDSVTLKV